MYALPPAVPATGGTQHLISPRIPASSPAQHTSVAPAVVQTVSVEHAPSRTDLLADVGEWTWLELKDYVAAEIIARFGPFPRDSRKEYGIFSRFFNTYRLDGIAVARFAFGPVLDGWWGRAPISVNRFCKASDEYFCLPILQRINQT